VKLELLRISHLQRNLEQYFTIVEKEAGEFITKESGLRIVRETTACGGQLWIVVVVPRCWVVYTNTHFICYLCICAVGLKKG
jgi:hypothetical protein